MTDVQLILYIHHNKEGFCHIYAIVIEVQNSI